MKLFKFRIVRETDYQLMIKALAVQARAGEAYRWFSGWRDLEILFNHIFSDKSYVQNARREYAKARSTDEYGVPNDR